MFCEKCGKELNDTGICSNCGFKTDLNAVKPRPKKVEKSNGGNSLFITVSAISLSFALLSFVLLVCKFVFNITIYKYLLAITSLIGLLLPLGSFMIHRPKEKLFNILYFAAISVVLIVYVLLILY